ncbi:MAG: helix-turn-helix domain-containing protein [Candidatus Dormibacteraceae bacterium]
MKSSKTKLGYHFRDARRERGWSQSKLARMLCETAEAAGYASLAVDANTISRWERSRQQPQPHHLLLLSRLFNQPAKQTEQEKAAPASPHSEQWERLARVVLQGGSIDQFMLREIEAQTAALYRLELMTPASEITSHLTLFLDQLTDLLSAAAGSDLRRRVVVSIGETAVLGGWLAWDSGDAPTSQRLYRVAAQAAREVGDSDLLACCFGFLSYAPSYEGNSSQTLELLGQALAEARLKSSPATYGWLEARRAEELAGLGDAAALPLLEGGLERFAYPKSDRLWTNFLTPTRVENFAVSVYLNLGRIEEAEPLALAALQTVEYPKLRPVVLADAATVNLRRGSLEAGLELAGEALIIAVELQSRWALGRLQRLGRLLREVNSEEAVRLASQINALTKSPGL